MLTTGGRQFVQGDPYLFDRAEIWRWVDSAGDEGTPTTERVSLGITSCRVDSITSRRLDMVFRTQLTATHQNFATIFLPPDVDIRHRDLLYITNRANEKWIVEEINAATGAFGIHHLEVLCNRVIGDV